MRTPTVEDRWFIVCIRLNLFVKTMMFGNIKSPMSWAKISSKIYTLDEALNKIEFWKSDPAIKWLDNIFDDVEGGASLSPQVDWYFFHGSILSFKSCFILVFKQFIEQIWCLFIHRICIFGALIIFLVNIVLCV